MNPANTSVVEKFRTMDYGVAPEDVPSPPAEEARPKRRRVKGYDLADDEPPPRTAAPPLDGYLPVGADADEDRQNRPPARPKKSCGRWAIGW